MNLIVDTNIVISGLITPNGTISRLILKDLSNSNLLCPEFILDELFNKFDKIKTYTYLNELQLNELFSRFTKRIEFIDDKLIDFDFQKQAYELVKDIDKKDLLFVALSLKTGYDLWTGDLKLIKGLKTQSFNQIITTKELLEKVT
jgi:predicted nucleic acid-binding protein